MSDQVLLWSALWGLLVGSGGVALGPFALILLMIVMGGVGWWGSEGGFPETLPAWIGWGVVFGTPTSAYVGAYAGEAWLHLPTGDLGWGTVSYLAGVALAAALWVVVPLLRSKALRREPHRIRVPRRDSDGG